MTKKTNRKKVGSVSSERGGHQPNSSSKPHKVSSNTPNKLPTSGSAIQDAKK